MSESEAMQEFCKSCIIRNKVEGAHGIEDRLERIERKQEEENIKLWKRTA